MSRIPENSNLLQQLMDNMTDNIFFKDRESKFIVVNKADAKWLGFSCPEEAAGKNDFDIFTEEFAQTAREDELRVMDTGEPVIGKEEKENWPDGSVSWVSTSKIPLRDTDGEIVGCIGIGRDISEIKEKERELEEAIRKLREVNEQISEDLRMAATLQHTFLPQTYPEFVSGDECTLLSFHHYYEADIEIGGDFCSVHKLSDSGAGLFICDVMGHGVRAALITSMIRTIADSLALQTMSPGDFLNAMNQQLFPLLQSEDAFLFATACYLTIDTGTGVLSGAMAGHTVPILIPSGQGRVSLLDIARESPGPALAVTADHAYHTFHVQLAAGDSVLLYTDGICEAHNASGEQFDVDQLQRTIQDSNTLPLKELLPSIVQTVRTFAGREKLGDDICLLGFTLNALR